jgi:hypothetical protein
MRGGFLDDALLGNGLAQQFGQRRAKRSFSTAG